MVAGEIIFSFSYIILLLKIFISWTLKTSGLYYKHTTIVNYASSIVNKLEEALLTEDARVVIYDRHVFIVQATALLAI